MTNKYEDFAETFTYFILHNNDFLKKSKDSEEAKANLIKRFELTEIQAQAILDMQLRRLAALEREKIERIHD